MNNILEPSGLGGILASTFRIFRDHFLKIVAVVLIAEVAIWLLGTILLSSSLSGLENVSEAVIAGDQAGAELAFEEFISGLSALIIGGLVFLVLSAAVTLLTYGALAHGVSHIHVHKNMDLRKAYRFAWTHLLNMAGASVLAALALIGIMILLVVATIILGVMWPPLALIGVLLFVSTVIYFGIRWIFIWPAVLLDGSGPTVALSRSAALVSGSWWRVFGITLAAVLLVLVGGLILGFTIGRIPILGGHVANILSAPVQPIVSILLYYDLRVRDGGYDLDTLEREISS